MHWSRVHADALVGLRALVASGRWTTVWPQIVAAMRSHRRDRSRQRRATRTTARSAADHPMAPPKRVVDGIPTAQHPWKRFPACPGGVAFSHSPTKK